MKENGGMQVISRAAAILRVLGSQSISLGAIAKATDLPRSTVQRIVDALAAENIVEAGIGGVRLGWGMMQLAERAQTDVVTRARPVLEALFARTHETVDLAAAHGAEVSFLDRIISDRELRVVPFPDRPRPLHAMANGKAILSMLPVEEVRALVGAAPERLTDRTTVDVEALLDELASVRKTGFAYDREEYASGVCAIGVPIIAAGLRPHALSVVVPSSRFAGSRVAIEDALAESRRMLEAALT